MTELTTIQNQQWYEALIEECGAIVTESVFASSWALIEGYHQLGQRIIEERENFGKAGYYGKQVTSTIAKAIHKSERTVERAVQFTTMYPDLALLPDGKNTNWHHICNKYLVAPKKDKPEVLNLEEASKALFDMVYQWGRVGVVTDHTAEAFKDAIKAVRRAKV